MAGGTAADAIHDVERQSFQKPRHLPNMKTIDANCTMNFYNTDVPDFGEYLLKETFADVHLVCKDQKIVAHRSRLSSVSPFLATVFALDTSEVSVVIVPDVKYDALRLLVHFIYTGFMRATEREVHDILEAGRILGIDRAIDVEHVNVGRTSSEPVRNKKRRAADSPESSKKKKKQTLLSSVLIINAGEYVGSESGRLCQPIDDPLDVPDVYSATVMANTLRRSANKEQTGQYQSSHHFGQQSIIQVEGNQHQSNTQAQQVPRDTVEIPAAQQELARGKTPDRQTVTDLAAKETSFPAPLPQNKLQQSNTPMQENSQQQDSLHLDPLVSQESEGSKSRASSSCSFQSCQGELSVQGSTSWQNSQPGANAGQTVKISQTCIQEKEMVNSAQSQCQLSKNPLNPEKSATQEANPSRLQVINLLQLQHQVPQKQTLEKSSCQLPTLPEIAPMSQESQNKNQQCLVNKDQNQSPQMEQKEEQAVSEEEKILQESSQVTQTQDQNNSAAMLRKSTSPSPQVPPNSGSSMSAQPSTQQPSTVAAKPAALKQTVQQAVAGLLLWKTSQMKQGSTAAKSDPSKVKEQQPSASALKVDLQQQTSSVTSMDKSPTTVDPQPKSAETTSTQSSISSSQQILPSPNSDQTQSQQQKTPAAKLVQQLQSSLRQWGAMKQTQVQETPVRSNLIQRPSSSVPQNQNANISATDKDAIEQLLTRELMESPEVKRQEAPPKE